jgi:putative ABC transport system substrate-binding protein
MLVRGKSPPIFAGKLSGTAVNPPHAASLDAAWGVFSFNKTAKGRVHMKKLKQGLMFVLVLALVLPSFFSAAAEQKKVYTIGIAQFAEHPSLDNCREGFIQGLAEAGFKEGDNVKFIVQNAQADMGMAQQIAGQLAEECDLVCAIATPVAQAAFNACMDKNIPVIYSAVSDPVGAMLANADGKNAKAVTGTCDLLPVEAQLKLIRAFLPDAKKIGILYTTSETNSESQLALYQKLAPEYGFELVATGISTGADIPLAMDSLLPQVDCLTNLTDNTVVSYLAVLVEKANTAGKPIFGSEIEQVKNGCIASEGVEYVSLGKQTGALAARVLKGEFAGDIPFVSSEGGDMSYNPTVAAALGIVIPQAELDRGIDVTKAE